uniref:Ig-like domain-containing protein n=1 Tax=Neogobius melanostomus TaxID=47308 RepID=A0A8C6SG05_9GOBI
TGTQTHLRHTKIMLNGTLLIQNANIKDRGQYVCLAENDQGSDKLFVTLSVVAYPSRILEPKMRELKSHAGNQVEINCKAEGRPGRVSVTDQGTLVIKKVSVYDRGHYKCIASNPAGADTATVRLQVVAAPPGILEEKRQVLKMSANQNIWLPCTGQGSPQPSIHWVLYDGTVVPTNTGTRGSRISVDVKLSDVGEYICMARNPAGESRKVYKIEIDGNPPVINGYNQNRTVITDVAAKYSRKLIDCQAEGNPKPKVTWIMPDNIFLSAPYFDCSNFKQCFRINLD